ncbi:MAG: transposase, partial [Myxococcota bacterium]
FVLPPGQRADITQALPLLETIAPPSAVVGDRAYDADGVLAWGSANEVAAVVPARRNRRLARSLDRGAYALRNVVDKTAASFQVVMLAAAFVERTAWS